MSKNLRQTASRASARKPAKVAAKRPTVPQKDDAQRDDTQDDTPLRIARALEAIAAHLSASAPVPLTPQAFGNADAFVWHPHGRLAEVPDHRVIAHGPRRGHGVLSTRLEDRLSEGPSGVLLMGEALLSSIRLEPRAYDPDAQIGPLRLPGARWRTSAFAKEIAAEIMETGEVTKSRVTLIARTEVGRTTTMLTQVRSEGVGATHYQWLSARDSDVRPLHKKLPGSRFSSRSE